MPAFSEACISQTSAPGVSMSSCLQEHCPSLLPFSLHVSPARLDVLLSTIPPKCSAEFSRSTVSDCNDHLIAQWNRIPARIWASSLSVVGKDLKMPSRRVSSALVTSRPPNSDGNRYPRYCTGLCFFIQEHCFCNIARCDSVASILVIQKGTSCCLCEWLLNQELENLP